MALEDWVRRWGWEVPMYQTMHYNKALMVLFLYTDVIYIYIYCKESFIILPSLPFCVEKSTNISVNSHVIIKNICETAQRPVTQQRQQQ